MAIFISSITLFSLVFSINVSTVYAKDKPSMKAANVRFDLQPGKEVTCYEDYASIGLRPVKVKVTNIRRKLINPYTMKTTITITVKNKHKFTAREVDRMMVDAKKWGRKGSDGRWIIATSGAYFVDYQTGKRIYGSVTYKTTKTKTYYGKGSYYSRNSTYIIDGRVTATIYYSPSNKNVCFGYVGSAYWNYRHNDAFAKYTGAFKTSEMYEKKNSRKTSVWLRLN